MNARLTDEFEVRCFAVMAEAAILEKRPEIRLLLAKALGSPGRRLHAALIQELFPGLPDAACLNLVRWAQDLGLCTEKGDVTREGGLAADGDVPVPEQGRWLAWFMDHPVFGRRVLHVERDGPRHNGANLEPLPFAPGRGERWNSAVDPSLRFFLRTFLDSDARGPLGQPLAASNCRLVWDLDFLRRDNRFRIEGRLADGKVLKHEGEALDGVDYDEIARLWTSGRPGAAWDASRRRLAVPFAGLSAEEVETFSGPVAAPDPEFRGRRFPRVEISDVPLRPKDAQAAERWAQARLLRRIPAGRCLTRSELRAAFFDAVWNTPLEDFGPLLPAHEDLVARAAELKLDPWALHAPVDLAPFEVPAEVLGALRVGAPVAHAAPAAEDGWFLYGFNEPRSMAALVERLVPPASSAQTVLLCDRHVRETHIASLRLFRKALLKTSPDCRLLIATRRHPEDPRQADRIREAAGTEPCFYEDLYGPKSHPHDRYLLVRPRAGDSWAWKMTGSPLDLRLQGRPADIDAPLPAPELGAYRHATDVVPDRLRRIFEENR